MRNFQMKKLATAVIVVSALFSSIPTAQAVNITPSPTFNVTATLTAACTAGLIPDLAFGNYVAFGGALTKTSIFTVSCTKGLAAPTYAYDVNNGVVAGLNYTLTAPTQTVVLGTAATPGVGGTPDVYTVTIQGDIAGGQAGDSTAPTLDIRTLTVTY